MRAIIVLIVIGIFILIIWGFSGQHDDIEDSKRKKNVRICIYAFLIIVSIIFALISKELLVGIIMFLSFGILPLILLIYEIRNKN